MDTHGPRIMVNVGTQAASNTGLNPRDLAPLTNDAFLATFMGKTALSASNGISRQHNNYRQSYTTQMERVTIRSKPRPFSGGNDINGQTSNGLDSDTAILSVIRGGDGSEGNQLSQRQLQGNRNRRRSFNQQPFNGGYNDLPCSPNYRPANFNGDNGGRRRRTRSGGQQISVVDQMAAQPHIPYAILPKRFEPKQVQGNGGQQQQQQQQQQQSRLMNNNAGRRRGRRGQRQQQQDYFDDDMWEDEEEDEDQWLERMPAMMRRRLNLQGNRRAGGHPGGYYGPRLMQMEDLYDPYSYGPMPRPPPSLRTRRRMVYPEDGFIPFDIVPSYDLNEWQGPYAPRPRQGMYTQQQRGGFRSGYGRNDNVFLRDDHRPNASTRQSRQGNQQRNGNKSTTPTRNGKQQPKSPKNKASTTNNNNGQQKRRNSRQRKSRNQNSKSEGMSVVVSSTVERLLVDVLNDAIELYSSVLEGSTDLLKSTTDETTTTKKTDDDKQRQDSLIGTENPLPPRDKNKDNTDENN